MDASTSLEDSSRFWVSTWSSPPRSSVTWYRVTGPTYETSRTVPSSTCAPGNGASPSSRTWIFSGRTVDRRPSRSITFETPTNPAMNSLRGVLVDLCGRPDLLDPAAVEHRDPVAHRERLLLVVRHVDERDPDLLLDLLQLDLHLLTELQVERAERLVEEEHPWPVDDRAGERHALPLAARELRRLAGAEALEPDHARAPRAARVAALGLRHASSPSARTRRSAAPSCAGTARSPGRRC